MIELPTIRVTMPFRLAALLAATLAFAQTQPTMKQLMLDLIHPAANEILLLVSRGGPADDAQWAAARRSSVTLAETGSLLTQPGRALDANQWPKDVRLLADAGAAAYKAALAKDPKALAAASEALDASCTACHKQYRPNVFVRQALPPANQR